MASVVVCVPANTRVTTMLDAASSLLPDGLGSSAPAEHRNIGVKGKVDTSGHHGGHKWTLQSSDHISSAQRLTVTRFGPP